jgi:site-specific recombinase XerD
MKPQRKAKKVEQLPRIYTPEQQQQFLSVINLPHHKMIARILFATGLRIAELLGSERDTCSYCSHYGPHYCDLIKTDVDRRQKACGSFNNLYVGVTAEDIKTVQLPKYPESVGVIRVLGKGRRVREVVIDPEILPAKEFLQYLQERNITAGRIFHVRPGRIQAAWKQYAKTAELPNIDLHGRWSPHTQRHTALTKVQAWGRDVVSTMEQAGHKDIKSTMIYVHLAAEPRVDLYSKMHQERKDNEKIQNAEKEE